MTKATAVHDRDGRPVLAVNVIEDVTEVKRAELTQRFLAAAGEMLASSLDYEETLARITRLAVPQLADWCAVSLPDGHGYLRSVAVAHVDPAKTAVAREYNERFAPRIADETGTAQVLRTGVSQVVNEIPDELLREAVSRSRAARVPAQLGMRAAMVVPMTAASGVIGTISFVSAESGRPFTAADVELAEELGRRAGAAVENARLYTERSRSPQTLQMGLLPDALPDIAGFELAALYRPAGAESFVGGDFYDAFATDRGWMIVVGDVTGRGAEAAALTAQARHTLRTAGTLLGDPVAAIDHLNRALAQQRDLPICTVAVGCSSSTTPAGAARTSRAPGIRSRCSSAAGSVRAVGAPGRWWARGPTRRGRPSRSPIEPGDVLVLYTDGVTDAVGADGPLRRGAPGRRAARRGGRRRTRWRARRRRRCRRSSAASRPTTPPSSRSGGCASGARRRALRRRLTALAPSLPAMPGMRPSCWTWPMALTAAGAIGAHGAPGGRAGSPGRARRRARRARRARRPSRCPRSRPRRRCGGRS